MQKRRFQLPPLDLLQSFEAAARSLSFTLAADELHLTQSAISRQIKQLEDHLGVTLFERHHRALTLTAQGSALQRAALEMLTLMQSAVDGIRADQRLSQLSLSTTAGFAAFWLIPRLRRFTDAHPAIDVRISATNVNVNLDRGAVDLAIRYTSRESAPAGAIPLFGEEIVPVCSPSLLKDPLKPLAAAGDLHHHFLLHLDYPGMERTWFDWDTWLTAFGVGTLVPAGALHFEQYDQMIGAAVAGQGVALGRMPLLDDLVRTGSLVMPFAKSVAGTRGYYLLRSPHSAKRRHVDDFCAWLRTEAARG
jgi:LysR family transcriptional regulator, glycine cleavage system transcriptional activator